MTRKLTVVWPDPRAFEGRDGASIRLLAVSDDVDPALDHAINREAIGRVDAIVGCGDLEPSYLCFLGDAFGVQVAYVRGNHDRGGHWMEALRRRAPAVVERSPRRGRWDHRGAVRLARPSADTGRLATNGAPGWTWSKVSWSLALRRLRGRRSPVLVLSHAPPRGVGDCESDPYHVGFAAYRWLLERLRPPLWLHGHTTPATVADWRDKLGSSMVVNVTGSVVVELVPPPSTAL